MEDLLVYLQTEGTCKCGLECPFKPDQVFSFDPKVQSRFGMLPNGADQNRQINCVVCKKFEELFPQTLKSKPTRGRKPGGMNDYKLSLNKLKYLNNLGYYHTYMPYFPTIPIVIQIYHSCFFGTAVQKEKLHKDCMKSGKFDSLVNTIYNRLQSISLFYIFNIRIPFVTRQKQKEYHYRKQNQSRT